MNKIVKKNGRPDSDLFEKICPKCDSDDVDIEEYSIGCLGTRCTNCAHYSKGWYAYINNLLILPDTGLTVQEQDCHNELLQICRDYHKLPIQHPDELRMFTDAIHVIQDLLMLRVARREYPKGWVNIN